MFSYARREVFEGFVHTNGTKGSPEYGKRHKILIQIIWLK